LAVLRPGAVASGCMLEVEGEGDGLSLGFGAPFILVGVGGRESCVRDSVSRSHSEPLTASVLHPLSLSLLECDGDFRSERPTQSQPLDLTLRPSEHSLECAEGSLEERWSLSLLLLGCRAKVRFGLVRSVLRSCRSASGSSIVGRYRGAGTGSGEAGTFEAIFEST